MRSTWKLALALGLPLARVSAGSTEDLSSFTGKELYARFCAACHGLEGHGDGIVASDLNVTVPDLTRLAHRHGGVFPVGDVKRFIDGRDAASAHGTRSMPVWGYRFQDAGIDARASDQIIERIVGYLRAIQAK